VNSRLYVGRLTHARLEPLRHAFKYPVYLLAVDLAELPVLDREVTLFGYNRLRPISLWDEDYLDRGGGSIRDKLMRFLERRGSADGISSTRLVTMGRCFNYAFNPVSFYYCCRADGSLRCAVAEVNNTYGERHLYILDEARSPLPPRPGFIARYTTPKELFVSPFNDLGGEYDFHFGPLDEAMDIKLDLVRDGRIEYQSRVCGRSQPFDDGALIRTLIRYPLSVALVLPRIDWQALVLRRRGLRALMKPNPTSPMTIRTATKPRSRALSRTLTKLARGRWTP
jgi:cyclopropane-fatty-acyl-phospholipid synthase